MASNWHNYQNTFPPYYQHTENFLQPEPVLTSPAERLSSLWQQPPARADTASSIFTVDDPIWMLQDGEKGEKVMASYRLVYPAASDGKLETINKKKKKEANAPDASLMNDTPNAKGVRDFYRLVEIGEPKEVEWRRKLGGMLMREIGTEETAPYNWILAVFPENYRLYEHVKITESKGSVDAAAESSRSVADRQDTYLYGHPAGRKKRYRSPADFFNHLLWLVQDENGDHDNCTCKVCAPDDIQCANDLFPELLKEAKQAEKMKKLEHTPKPNTYVTQTQAKQGVPIPKVESQAARAPLVVIPKQAPFQPQAKPQKPAVVNSKPVMSPVGGAPPRNMTPMLTATPLLPAKSREQELDSQYAVFLYRPGELVWFSRGPAWGLSVIINRTLSISKDTKQNEKPKYLVQPLSHPFGHSPPKIMSAEADLRPWLAWSCPAPTISILNAPNLNYNTVDWKTIVTGQFGHGDPEVDGSIFASKMIDESFTLIQGLTNNTVTTGERTYNGIYLGGEKIWVGEAVRTRTTQGQEILVVHDIIERLKPGSTNAASASIILRGDIYRFITVQSTAPMSIPSMSQLPARLLRDLEFRNLLVQRVKTEVSAWKLIQVGRSMGIHEIKGRWYESSTLLPILQGMTEFHNYINHGLIKDVGGEMNARGDSSTLVGGQMGKRFITREEAFGLSVPKGTKINKGLDGPREEQGFPEEEGVGGVGGQEQDGGDVPPVVDEMDDFLNMDRLGEGLGNGGQGWDGQQ